MTDKEWLDKVYHAYKVYEQSVLYHERKLDDFIVWLYQQYGIIPPKKD